MSGWTWRAPKRDDRAPARRRRRTRGRRSPSRSTGRASRGSRSRTARTGGSGRGSGGRPPWARSGRRRRAPRPASRPGRRRRGRGRAGSSPRRSRTGRASWRAKTSIVTSGSRPSRSRIALGAREVDVGRVARQDLARRPRADEAHQSGSAPVCASSRGWVSGGAEVAASVAYGSITGTRSVGTSGEARRDPGSTSPGAIGDPGG